MSLSVFFFSFFFWGNVIACLPGSIHLSLNLYVGKWKAHHASSIPHSADSALWQTLQDEFISAESLHLWEIYEDVSFNWGPPVWGLIDTVLLIADDISLGGSLICVPDRKAVLWRGCYPPTPAAESSCCEHYRASTFLRQKNYGVAHPVFFLCVRVRTL